MEKAKQSVSDLQKTINETTVAPENQQTLDELAQHCDDFQAEPEVHQQSLRDRLERSLAEFGADHPSLSQAMQVAISDLSNAGV